MELARIERLANQLYYFIDRITAEEFFWQDANFNNNSRRGRELLYLICNDEWIPSTTERIDLHRADLVDTDLVLEVDLAQIRHEAFHDGGGLAWLPLLVLPRPENADPVGDLRVTDAQGTLRSTVRLDHVRHAVSAAIAEIMVNSAAASWPPDDENRPHAHRDLRLLLSAAVFRMLHAETGDASPGTGTTVDGSRAVHRTERISQAGVTLKTLLGRYRKLAKDSPPDDRFSHSRRMAEQAAELADALSRAIVVVITEERSMPPAVFTVSTPARNLGPPSADGKTGRPHWLSRLRPHAELRIDLLLPSSSADRYVEVNLPDGVSLADAGQEGMAITVARPRSAAMLEHLMDQIVEDRGSADDTDADAGVLCLADLAHAKATALSYTLSEHQIVPGETGENVPERLARLQKALTKMTAVSSLRDPAPLDELRDAWDGGRWLGLGHGMLRQARTSRPVSDTRTLTGVAYSGADVTDQPEPLHARVVVPVQAAEARFVSIARLSGTLSAVLMSVVFLFFLFSVSLHLGHALNLPGLGAVAAALTLFSIIQAGRADVPDRSTLRGFLSAGPGNSLIVWSVLPSVVLVIALAFESAGWAAVGWAGGMLALQLTLLAGMTPRVLYGNGWRQPRVLETSPVPEYRRAHVLRTARWQITTANTLMKNRPTFGYVVWSEEKTRGTLRSVIDGGLQSLRRGAPAPGEWPNNALSMLRASFGARPMTFVVFRDPPRQEWKDEDGRKDIHLDLSEQAMNATPLDEVDVFAGSPGDPSNAADALSRLCQVAAEHGLVVLNARLPEPPPGADPGCRWARLRLGLREGEAATLRELLRDMSKALFPKDTQVLVRTARGGRMRFAHPPHRQGEAVSPDAHRPVLASDLDPVVPGRTGYRVLAMHASAHAGIEQEVFAGLAAAGGDLKLVAVTYALLHGTSVFLLLGALPGRPPAEEDRALAREILARELDGSGVHVDVDDFRRGDELGTAADSPLLRVLLRTPERPGALIDATDALAEAVASVIGEKPADSDDGREDFWHGVMESGSARTTTVRLTQQLPASAAAEAGTWNGDVLRDIEHRVRLSLARRAAERQARPDAGGEAFGPPEDAAADVKLIRSG